MSQLQRFLSALTLSAAVLLGAQSLGSTANATPDAGGGDRDTSTLELSVSPAPGINQICPITFQENVDRILNQPTFAGAQWGVLIEPIAEEIPLFQRNPENYFIPASNMKLLTTSAALQVLDYRNQSISAQLVARLQVINRDSNNAYADALLNQIGGADVVRAALAPMGVDPNSYRVADGSGLSRSNMAKPSTFVDLLRAMRSDEEGDLFYSSLAIAGVNGTLRNRFRDTAAQYRLHGKTGTLRGVRALSGYLQHADYGEVVFSILINQPSQSGEVMLRAIDQIVLEMTRLTPCE